MDKKKEHMFYMKKFKCIVWIECELGCDFDICQNYKVLLSFYIQLNSSLQNWFVKFRDMAQIWMRWIRVVWCGGGT
jgi:hypothetical protein